MISEILSCLWYNPVYFFEFHVVHRYTYNRVVKTCTSAKTTLSILHSLKLYAYLKKILHWNTCKLAFIESSVYPRSLLCMLSICYTVLTVILIAKALHLFLSCNVSFSCLILWVRANCCSFCLFVWGFSSPLKMFHSYGDVPVKDGKFWPKLGTHGHRAVGVP